MQPLGMQGKDYLDLCYTLVVGGSTPGQGGLDNVKHDVTPRKQTKH